MLTPRFYYAFFMLLGGAAFLVVQRLQPKTEAATLRWREKGALLLAAFIGGALGGKLPFVLFAGGQGLGLWAWTTDGKTITTAIAGAYLAVEATKWALGIRVKTGDAFALPAAVALAIGRWGCFFGGCCYGAECDLPWAVPFEHEGVVALRHPTQIYESLFHASMAVVLIVVIRFDVLKYQRLKLYLIAYFIYRFLTEFIRPEPGFALGLTWYQWTALCMMAALTVHWVIDERAKRRTAQQDKAEHTALARNEPPDDSIPVRVV